MNMLSQVEKPRDRAPIITICGDAGTGKTSLAASFPKPIFIRLEDGLGGIPADQRPDAFPLVKSPQDLWDQLMAVLKEEHDYKTLVLDSITEAERYFITAILDADPRAKGLNQAMGGYGNGRAAVAADHQRVRKACGVINEKRNMNIVFVAHADIETMKLPDADDYSRWSLRLMPGSLPPYVDNVDLVGFVRLVSAVRGDDGERKKVISNGERELVCYATAASVSKNRFGITEPLDLIPGENPLLGLMPGLATVEAVAEPKRAAKPAKTVNEEENAA